MKRLCLVLLMLCTTCTSVWAWVPTNDPNLLAWFKADAGVVTNASNGVTGWNDQSGNGYNLAATIVGSAVAPLLSTAQFTAGTLPVIEFNNHNCLQRAIANGSPILSSSVSVYAVVQVDPAEVTQDRSTIVVLAKPSENSGWMLKGGNGDGNKNFHFKLNGESGDNYGKEKGVWPTQKDTAWHVLAGRFDEDRIVAEYCQFYQDWVKTPWSSVATFGTETGTASLTYQSGTCLTVGANAVWSNDAQYAFWGKIAEIIIFESADDEQFNNVRAYLGKKYFAKSSFPGNDPNCIAWFKADEGIVTNVSGGVTDWNDLSGYLNNVKTQTLGSATYPTVGSVTFDSGLTQSVINFNNHNCLKRLLRTSDNGNPPLETTIPLDPLMSESVTVYTVIKADPAEVSENKSVVVAVAKAPQSLGWSLQGGNDNGGTNWQMKINDSAGTAYGVQSNMWKVQKDSAWHLLSGRFDASRTLDPNVSVYLDGARSLWGAGTVGGYELLYNTTVVKGGDLTVGTGSNLIIGALGCWSNDAQYAFNGKVAEIIIFDSADNNKFEHVRKYLSEKYLSASDIEVSYFNVANAPNRTNQVRQILVQVQNKGMAPGSVKNLSLQVPDGMTIVSSPEISDTNIWWNNSASYEWEVTTDTTEAADYQLTLGYQFDTTNIDFAAADFDLDGFVNMKDLDVLVESWLMDDAVADIAPIGSPDGIVNFLDFAILADLWLDASMPAMTTTVSFDAYEDFGTANYVPTPQPVTTSADVFAYYMPGREEVPKWCQPPALGAGAGGWYITRDYSPGRKPTLGYYDESIIEAVDWQIKWAVENGVTGFIMDWYWDNANEQTQICTDWLNSYRNAQYRDYLKLSLFWCSIADDEYEDVCQYWIDNYFNLPSYFKLNGKPVIFVDMDELHDKFENTSEVTAAISAMNSMAVNAGYSGIYFVGLRNDLIPIDSTFVSTVASEGVSGFTTYNERDARGTAGEPNIYSYQSVVDNSYSIWTAKDSLCGTSLTYYPVACTGWDNRAHGIAPWRIEGRTAARFQEVLSDIKSFGEANNKPFVILGPQTEWEEGSYIMPCTEFGFDMYEAIRNVFSTDNPSTWPANIAPWEVNLGPYDFSE